MQNVDIFNYYYAWYASNSEDVFFYWPWPLKAFKLVWVSLYTNHPNIFSTNMLSKSKKLFVTKSCLNCLREVWHINLIIIYHHKYFQIGKSYLIKPGCSLRQCCLGLKQPEHLTIAQDGIKNIPHIVLFQL